MNPTPEVLPHSTESTAATAAPAGTSNEALSRARLDIERLQRELLQARAELEEFTQSVSHDLRASLRHVTSYVQIVVEELGSELKPDVAAHLQTVTQAARQMGRQIDGLTELSRLTGLTMQWTDLDLGLLVSDVRLAMPAEPPGRVVGWQIASDVPPLRGDLLMIRQVMMNLFFNALKFSVTQAVTKIEVDWRIADDGWCLVTVSDNGVGFNPDYADKLFHAFQRLHSPRDFEGLGMGLALTRKIIERHGGTVWATAKPKAGCSVSFTLPLA
jgi:light-regulated signal transduction histidine kinase (bacteriophytochrome)